MKTLNKPSVSVVQEEAIRWLALLNSSSLTEAQEQEFFIWLEQSPLHQAAYVKAEQLWQRGAVLARVKETERKNFWTTSSWQGWAMACTFLAVVSWSLFLLWVPESQHYHYQTAKGEQQEQLLEDGSRIVLNTNSAVDIRFEDDRRLVELQRGEVFFDVTKEPRPFDVITQLGVVRVLGTHFSVYYSAANDVQVTVVEGRVALGKKIAGNEEFSPQVILQSNQRLNMSGAMAGAAPESIDAGSALAWRKKQLVFKGQSLDAVINEMNRYLSGQIKLADPKLGTLEITAVIQLNDPQSSLAILAQSLGLQLAVDNNRTHFTLHQ